MDTNAERTAEGASTITNAHQANTCATKDTTPTAPAPAPNLLDQYQHRRHRSEQLIEGLTQEDMAVQSMPDASPTKWHLAHTTWFFEQFLLKPHTSNYQEFDADFSYLFNSYYNNIGQRHRRDQRGLLTRPSFDRVMDYRAAIDEKVQALLAQPSNTEADRKTQQLANKQITGTTLVGLHHEMQHQELMLTDVLHLLSHNCIRPAMRPAFASSTSLFQPLDYQSYDKGLYVIGAEKAHSNAFSFDCEHPRHQIYQTGFSLANRAVTNREWLEFMYDGGYSTATLWLSDGWAECLQHQWQAPLYWIQQDQEWFQFSLYGLTPIDLNAPVCHISYYEADAYATWANARLPTEQEWEIAAVEQPIAGNFQEANHWTPKPAHDSTMQQLYGDVWEWTRSPYSPYPGYQAPAGAIGEYNGKFMSGQFVLRGGSCATPIEQLRPSYRNFFYPHQRWQFSGLRLAKDS